MIVGPIDYRAFHDEHGILAEGYVFQIAGREVIVESSAFRSVLAVVTAIVFFEGIAAQPHIVVRQFRPQKLEIYSHPSVHDGVTHRRIVCHHVVDVIVSYVQREVLLFRNGQMGAPDSFVIVVLGSMAMVDIKLGGVFDCRIYRTVHLFQFDGREVEQRADPVRRVGVCGMDADGVYQFGGAAEQTVDDMVRKEHVQRVIRVGQ